MKPPKFSIGQAVVCVEVGQSHESVASIPRLNQVYTVSDLQYLRLHQVQNCGEGWYVALCELPAIQYHQEFQFAPVELLPAEALAELLEALEPVTA